MVVCVKQLLVTRASPLETLVAYAIPGNDVLEVLLPQLEGLLACWNEYTR